MGLGQSSSPNHTSPPTLQEDSKPAAAAAAHAMAGPTLAVVQPKPIPSGTPEYEEKRAAVLQAFSDAVPAELRLSPDITSNPPVDVSGIPASCGILTPEELDITENYDATALAEAIAARKLTSVDVTRAFAKRAIIAHQLTCCLTQWFMDEALEQAGRLDAHLAEHGTTVGPLHGVPVSIKEHIPVAGTYSSQGCFSSTVRDDRDSQMVAILRDAGAVFYCKTNQPQTLMHLESDSHFGRVLCPFNINLSAGGSTGGEAALVAIKGSPLGVGTDIGGSVRGPSAFCGIYGFKPTAYTLPMRDFIPHPFPGELNVLCSTGPMCRTARDMELFMGAVLDAKPYLTDPRIVPIPWTGTKTPAAPGPLKVGIVAHDGFIQPQPPVARALSWARELLSDPKLAGKIEVKEFTPFGAAEAWSKVRRMYWPDGGKLTKDAITSAGEPLHPLSEWIWKDAEPLGMQTAEGVSSWRRERDDFRIAFAESWQDQDVDVIISPAFVGTACAHDTAFYWTYTSLYNLVDYPGVVVPTPIKAGSALDDKYPADYSPLSDACAHVKELWEAGGFEGAPVDLQIVARKYHDNQLFGALAVLKDALGLP